MERYRKVVMLIHWVLHAYDIMKIYSSSPPVTVSASNYFTQKPV